MSSFDCPTDFRVQGWGVSLIAHAALVSLAVMAVAQVKFVPDRNVFRWEVAIVRPPTSEPTMATTEPQPPASSVSQPTPATTSPPAAPKPSVARQIESKQVESARLEPKTLLARPIEEQVLERRQVEQVRPIKQAEASRQIETVTSRPVETEAYEKAQVVQERQRIEDKATPVVTQAPHEAATVHKQEVVSTTQPMETPLPTTEVGSVESPQPVTKKIVPVEQTPVRAEPAPVTQQIAAESPSPATRDVAPRLTESPPDEPHPTAVARADQGPAADTVTPPASPVPSAENVREQAPSTAMVAKAFPTPRADFGWLTQALWRKIEQLKRYPHKARLNRLGGHRGRPRGDQRGRIFC